MFLARLGFGKPKFDFRFAVARILDEYADPLARTTVEAVRTGDLDALKGYLQSKITYPTDRKVWGENLLAVSTSKYLSVSNTTHYIHPYI